MHDTKTVHAITMITIHALFTFTSWNIKNMMVAMSILEDIKAIVPQYHGDCNEVITTRFHDDPMQMDVLHALSRLAGQFDNTGKRPSIITEFGDNNGF